MRAGLFTAVLWTVLGCRSASAIELISRTPGDLPANSSSNSSSVSADGRYVAFESGASDLVAGDTNAARDVFVRDRQTGTTERVSVATGGAQGDGASYNPVISADGRYVAFASMSSNFAPGLAFGEDVYIHDRQSGTTEIVSVPAGGALPANNSSYHPAISADGRYVAFASHASNLIPLSIANAGGVFVRDRQTGAVEIVSISTDGNALNGTCTWPSISPDGRFVAFVSSATNLVVGGDSNGVADIFIFDRQSVTSERVNITTGGGEANSWSDHPTISADGRYVTFQSSATNLVPLDTNGKVDIFLRDRQTHGTERVSVGPAGVEGDYDSFNAVVSANGRWVVFESIATNFVENDTGVMNDIFVRDRLLGELRRISVRSDGLQAHGSSYVPQFSQNGAYVVFESTADDLVAGDTNGQDIFFTVNPFFDPDSDGDGVSDALDGCPIDPLKTAPGVCGCGMPEGSCGGEDLCPLDPQKTAPGVCGCGVTDSDSDGDGDGTIDCLDQCPADENKIVPGSAGCGALDLLAPDTVLGKAPIVTVGKGKVVVRLERFAGVASSAKPRPFVRYVVELRPVAKTALAVSAPQRVTRVISRRNKVIVRHLAPGAYEASYQAQAVQKKRVQFSTNWSPSAQFVVPSGRK